MTSMNAKTMSDEAPDSRRGARLNYTTALAALAAVVILTVAVVVPEVGATASRKARATALADANAIGVALRQADADVGRMTDSGAPAPAWLFGPGVMPRGGAFTSATGFPLSGILAADRAKVGARWRGPYLEQVPIDPWGRAYVVLLEPSRRGSARVVVSAGPDGILDTHAGDAMIAGDDVGIVLTP
jgi:hypothetical protein